MTGWKTKWGGIAGICTGIGTCMTAITWEPFSIDGKQFAAGIALITLSLEGMGIGHKIEKANK